MPFEKFKNYFKEFQVCMIEDDFKYTCVRSQCSYDQSQYFKMTINKASTYYITVSQESKRKFSKFSGYKYSDVSIIIGKILSNNKYEYVGGFQKADKEVFCKAVYLNPGQYIVYVQIDWY